MAVQPLQKPVFKPIKPELSARSYFLASEATSWVELREAGAYYSRLSQLLETARKFVVFVGWQIDSRLPLPGAGGIRSEIERLKDKVLRLAEENPELNFYFLVWDHAYFYCLERETLQGRVWDDIHPRVHFIFDNRHPFGGSHHEKIVLIDGRVALSGGIDLCDDRWDTPVHRFQDRRRGLSLEKEEHGPYHDLSLEVTGPICAQLQSHVGWRWRRITNIPFPAPVLAPVPQTNETTPAGQRIYLSRTRADDRLIREIEFLFKNLVGMAERRIVIEAQYYWSGVFNEALIGRMHQKQGEPFEVTIILADLDKLGSPVRLMAHHGMRLLKRLKEAAHRTGTRLTIATPEVQSRSGPERKPIYVHSKVIVIDDRFLSVGSANLAARALRLDSEIALTLEARTPEERRGVDAFTKRLLDHWNQSLNPDVHLREIEPADEARELQAYMPWLTRFPWEVLFDPSLPWLYRFNRRLGHWSRTRAGLVVAAFAIVATLGAWVASGLARGMAPGGSPGAVGWAAALLSISWLVPVPYVALSLLFALAWQGPAASAAAVPGLWISALCGYGLTRLFPSTGNRFYRRTAPAWLPQQLGLRSFPHLLAVIADPRIGFRTKIAYQGLYSVPAPWFALSTMLVLPSVVHVACMAVGWLAPEVGWIRASVWRLAAGLIALGAVWFAAPRLVRHRKRKRP